MTVRDDRGDVKQTTTGFRGPLMVQSLTSAKSKFLSLEDRVLVGGGCRIWDTNFHSLDPNVRNTEFDEAETRPIIIKRNAFIGGGSTLLKGVIIGENSIVAAGSVVGKNIPDNEIWGGNPAQFIKKTDYD